MKQSTIIFGTILFAFVIYITMRGQLPEYLDLFSSGTSTRSKGATKDVAESPVPSPSGITKSFGDVLDKATKFLQGIK